MVVGAVTTIAFAVAQSNCDSTVVGDIGGVIQPHAGTCGGYAVGAGIGLGVLVAGAVLVVVGLVLSTPRYRQPPR